MMNRYSCPVNADRNDRVFFFYWEDMINYLREQMEADGNTYRMKITEWKGAGKKGENKASCQLQWVRINPETQMAEMVTRTVTCEDADILPTEVYCCGPHKRLVWTRAEW